MSAEPWHVRPPAWQRRSSLRGVLSARPSGNPCSLPTSSEVRPIVTRRRVGPRDPVTNGVLEGPTDVSGRGPRPPSKREETKMQPTHRKLHTLKSVVARALLGQMLMWTTLFAGDLVNVAGASHTAIDGYDPVAFFTDSKPVHGSPSITATHEGAVYFFATEEHRKLFERNPDKYVPQYGGFCAYAVSQGKLAPVDISTWQVRDGKLYLNFDHDVLQKFNADFDGYVVQADRNWPGLVA